MPDTSAEDRLWEFEFRQRTGYSVMGAVWGAAIPSTKFTSVPHWLLWSSNRWKKSTVESTNGRILVAEIHSSERYLVYPARSRNASQLILSSCLRHEHERPSRSGSETLKICQSMLRDHTRVGLGTWRYLRELLSRRLVAMAMEMSRASNRGECLSIRR